jgi:polygalacturonase
MQILQLFSFFLSCETAFGLVSPSDVTSVSRINVATSVVPTNAKRCIPQGGGLPDRDDTAAIASAIKECGAGGTVVIPQQAVYFLGNTLDLTGCDRCRLEIDGTLKASPSSKSWETKRCIINVKKMTGLKLTSPLKSGVLDGSGQEA